MASGAVSRRSLERKIRNLKLISEWKRRSLKNRCSLANLAKALGLTRAKTVGMVNLRPKQVVRTREKIKVIKEVSVRVGRPVRRRDTATKVASDLRISSMSVRTVQRLRRPYRDKEIAARTAQIEENRGVCRRLYRD